MSEESSSQECAQQENSKGYLAVDISDAEYVDNIELSDEKPAQVLLDVMKSVQFNRLLTVNSMLLTYTLLHAIGLCTLCNTGWKKTVTSFSVKLQKEVTTSWCTPPRWYRFILYGADPILSITLYVFTIIFVLRICFCAKKYRNEAQAWAVMMVILTALSYFPFLPVVFFQADVITNYDMKRAWFRFTWVREAQVIIRNICLFAASFAQIFYTWACAHSFGILNEEDRPSKIRFYGPKIVTLIVYGCVRLALSLNCNMLPSKLPLVTMLAMLANLREIGWMDRNVALLVSLLTLFELLIFAAVVRRIWNTSKKLQNVPYLKNRSKQIGFRFFVMQNAIIYFLFLVLDCFIILGVPRGFDVQWVLNPPYFLHSFWNSQFPIIPRILNYSVVVITAYVNLPADSVGIMGWIRGSTRGATADPEPISLKVRNNFSNFDVSKLSSKLILELQVMLFNIADVAYGIKSQRDQRVVTVMQYVKKAGFEISAIFSHQSTDTIALVLSRIDCLVIAFKGTTSAANMRTDLKVLQVPIDSTLPSRPGFDHDILRAFEWKNAKVHEGFGKAYKKCGKEIIDQVAHLTRRSARPIYVTGHSLGGALAAICSVDIVLSLGITDIYTTSFGSPKCGNFFWSRLCNQLVPAHWRLAMRSDVITTLPGFGYSHAGKRVALTNSGEIFLDPNAIETMIWSSSGLSLADHAKPAYEAALLLFCSKYLPTFTPTFLGESTAEDDDVAKPLDVESLKGEILSITLAK